jgi:hypothetical protein
MLPTLLTRASTHRVYRVIVSCRDGHAVARLGVAPACLPPPTFLRKFWQLAGLQERETPRRSGALTFPGWSGCAGWRPAGRLEQV